MTSISIKVVSVCTTTASFIAFMCSVPCKTLALSLEMLTLVSELGVSLVGVGGDVIRLGGFLV